MVDCKKQNINMYIVKFSVLCVCEESCQWYCSPVRIKEAGSQGKLVRLPKVLKAYSAHVSLILENFF